MKRTIAKLSLGLGLLSLMAVISCGPTPNASSTTVAASSSGSGPVVITGKWADYTLVANSAGSVLKGIAFADDVSNLYVYMSLCTASNLTANRMFIVSVGRTDNAGNTNFAAKSTWGWGDAQRDYGTATNLFEIKISTVPVSTGTNTWINALENGNLQVMFTNGENKVVSGGSITSNLGDAFATATTLELKIAKSNVSLSGVSVDNLRFFAALCSWGESWYSNEMIPAANLDGTRVVRGYVKKDGTVISAGGTAAGSAKLSAGAVAPSATGSLTVTVRDLDKATGTASIKVSNLNTTSNFTTTVAMTALAGTKVINIITNNVVADAATATIGANIGDQIQVILLDDAPAAEVVGDTAIVGILTNLFVTLNAATPNWTAAKVHVFGRAGFGDTTWPGLAPVSNTGTTYFFSIPNYNTVMTLIFNNNNGGSQTANQDVTMTNNNGTVTLAADNSVTWSY